MTTENRVGNWSQTFTGRAFWPLDPRPEDVDIHDIAHALSNVCRFGGHCKRFYSVAQHSVHVHDLVIETRPDLGFQALFHDAAEAYIGDMIRPLKEDMHDFRKAEKKIIQAILSKFGMSDVGHDVIRDADNSLLLAEKRDLLEKEPYPWCDLGVEPYSTKINPWSPERAMALFLTRFNSFNLEKKG
jgi:hypothetical protein